MRWAEDYHLFFLGAFSFGCAVIGRSARRHQWPKWATFHISGMGASYIVLLSAFYVDNGKNLPIWRDLPTFTYWLLPVAIGIPIIVHALLRHPVVRRTHDLEEVHCERKVSRVIGCPRRIRRLKRFDHTAVADPAVAAFFGMRRSSTRSALSRAMRRSTSSRGRRAMRSTSAHDCSGCSLIANSSRMASTSKPSSRA